MSIHTNAVVTILGSVVLLGLACINPGLAAVPLGPQKLQAAPPVCAKGFVVQGNGKGYSCTSETFKCNANLQVLYSAINANRASYVCGLPPG